MLARQQKVRWIPLEWLSRFSTSARRSTRSFPTAGRCKARTLTNAAPFLLFLGLGAINMGKALDDFVLKEMSEDEALLYAQFFYSHGFTQAEFSKLCRCPGCHWAKAQPGEVINHADDHRVKLVVKGSTRVTKAGVPGPGVHLRAGSSVGDGCVRERGGALHGLGAR